ncbi:MAG: GntR family transcriptional regulator [Oscillospiraceae bacterium]|nr:GntR family transcriptional regulator [Oscillospiraceae bacterium]
MKKYEQVAADIRDNILSGRYTEGQTLPTEDALSSDYNVSRQTIRHALALLVDEELISKRQGSGSTVIAPSAHEKTRTIAVVATYLDDYIFPSQLRAVEEVLSANRYQAFIAATKNQVYNERAVLEELLNRPVDGILIEGTKTAMPNPNFDLYARLINRQIPIVFFNSNYPELDGTISVCADNFGGGYALVKHLLEKGHTKIAGIFKSDDIQGHQRYSGYITALRDAGLLVPDERVIWYTTETRKSIFKHAENTLRRFGDSTAVVCYNDDIALSLIRFLNSQGKRVPEDFAVAGFDNSSLSEISNVRITSLSYGENNIGHIAAQKLVDLLAGKKVQSEAVKWILEQKEST